MNLFRKFFLIHKLTVIVLFLVMVSISGVKAQAPGCESCSDSDYLIANYSAYPDDQKFSACVCAECTNDPSLCVPVNTNSWVLVALGVSLVVVGFVISKKSKE